MKMGTDRLWLQTLSSLKNQMTDATYNAHLAGTTAQRVNGHLEVVVANDTSREWLDFRLAPSIKQTLAHLAGQPIDLVFVAKPTVLDTTVLDSTEANAVLARDLVDLPEATNPQDSAFVRGINFKQLWFQTGGSGFDRIAKYWSRFWRAYLNRRNSRTYSLWEYLQNDDYSNQEKAPYWTTERKRRIRPIARALGCSPKTITGGFRQCSVFNKDLQEGVPRSECCKNHQPSDFMYLTQNKEPRCLFWETGALEVLDDEGLVSLIKIGTNARNTFYHIQVWRLLPLLTPWQVEQLHEVEREAHEIWVQSQVSKGYFSQAGFDTYGRHQMVAQLPARDQGRLRHTPYKPNPLLESIDSNNSDE